MQFFIHIMMLIANVCRFLGKDLYLLILQAIESLADWLYLLVILNGIRRKMNENHLAIGKSSSFSSINVQLSIAICSIIRRFFRESTSTRNHRNVLHLQKIQDINRHFVHQELRAVSLSLDSAFIIIVRPVAPIGKYIFRTENMGSSKPVDKKPRCNHPKIAWHWQMRFVMSD